MTSSERFNAVIVSADRQLLRRLSWLLETVGCAVDQSAEPERAELLLKAGDPDFVLIDMDLPAGLAEALCSSAADANDDGPAPVVLALVTRCEVDRIDAALAAGADDILHKPLVAGEVLARIRAAARLREQLWRRNLQQGNSQTLGCLPTPAWRALVGEVGLNSTGMGTCVFVAIDHLREHSDRLTRVAAAHLRASVVERLQLAGGDEAVWGELGNDSYAALLTNCDDVAAGEWAEALRKAVMAQPFEWDDRQFSITVSMSVVGLNTNATVAEQRGRGALELAIRCGHNCVITANEWEQDQQRLQELPQWLDSTNAWDMMLPAPLALYPDDQVEQAAILLLQTQLSHLPVVDTAGRLVGLVSSRCVHASERKTTSPRSSGSCRYVRAIMDTRPSQFEEDTPARKIAAFFAAESATVAVVTRHGRPLGLVYSHSISSMSECLTRRTFASSQGFSLDSDYLCAPETCTNVES